MLPRIGARGRAIHDRRPHGDDWSNDAPRPTTFPGLNYRGEAQPSGGRLAMRLDAGLGDRR
jgi:hypothetical protein